MWFFLAGGFPMIFVLVFGLVAVAAAGRFAWKPEIGRLGHIAALCVSLGFASLAGVCTDLIAVSRHVPEMDLEDGQLGLVMLVGLGESLSPAVLGFSLIAIVALVSAVGLRGMPARV
jgi:hypothetical protein